MRSPTSWQRSIPAAPSSVLHVSAPRPRSNFGDEDVDRLISQLLLSVGEESNDDLVRKLIVTALDMDEDNVDRLELKIASQSLVEMLNAWRVFSPYSQRAKVTIFGSARTDPSAPNYAIARDFSSLLANRGWMAISGAGPGIMTAAIEGAGVENSFGVNIVLPFEQMAADIIEGNEKLATFRYFFTRKLFFMKESDAFAVLPGGFGTLDETFELLTLIQTGKSYPVPIVLLDHPGSTYWHSLRRFIDSELLDNGMIRSEDTSLFLHTHDPAEAAEYVCSFYACFHSMRYVGRRLVLRLNHEISDETVAVLNTEFADIVSKDSIERTETTESELRDNDHPLLPRLIFSFDNRSFARLTMLIRRINDLSGDRNVAATEGLVHDLEPEPDDF